MFGCRDGGQLSYPFPYFPHPIPVVRGRDAFPGTNNGVL